MNAQAWRRFHAIAAVAWMFPGVLVAYLIVFALPDQRLAAFAILVVSLYANAVGHWGAYQATRAESVADPTDQSVSPSGG